jgi:hypothetical protein
MKLVEPMRVETRVTVPVTSTTTESIILVPRLGLLDVDAGIHLSVLSNDSAFPIATGIRACIQNAELRIGGVVCLTSRDTAEIATVMRSRYTPSYRTHIDAPFTGAIEGEYASVAGQLGHRWLSYGAVAGGVYPTTVPAIYRTTTVPSTSFAGRIPLHELFDFFKTKRLPVGMIDQDVTLHLTWNTQDDVIEQGGRVVVGQASATVDPNSVRFVADYLFYPEAHMQAVQQAIESQGLSIPYNDYVQTIITETVPQDATTIVERQLALNGKTVQSIVVVDRKSNTAAANGAGDARGGNYMYGFYNSESPKVCPLDNYTVNDSRLYDRDLDTAPKHMQSLANALGSPMSIPSPFYSAASYTTRAGVLIVGTERPFSPVTFEAVVAALDTLASPCGQAFYSGVDMKRDPDGEYNTGTKIGVAPVLYRRTYNMKANEGGVRTIKLWATYERIMTIFRGRVLCADV